jgi:hypothetical protein
VKIEGNLFMSEEIRDQDLGPELRPKKAKEKIVDYQALASFIRSNFPISKTDYILKMIESMKDSPNYQTQYNRYADKLSNDDLNKLFDGINASTTYK